MRTAPPRRDRYPHFLPIATRWMDNDLYGHVNNVVYYSYFDTVINEYLVTRGGLDIAQGPVIGLCVESQCAYVRPLSFPGVIEAGLRVEHLGTSSVRYDIGIFAAGSDAVSAYGRFVHVFVDRVHRRPTALPDPIRTALELLRGHASTEG